MTIWITGILKKMKTMIYDDFAIDLKPDYAFAQSKAYEVIQDSNQTKLPLSIKKIIKSYPNLHLQKYTVFAKKRHINLDEVFEVTNSEEGCLWMRNDGTYLILYNDTLDNPGRIRFTLAHELGHYILKHNEKTGKTILSRYSLSSEEYDLFEKEANYFAKRLLAPIPLVDLYVANWKKITATCIEFAFNTSYTVANYVLNDLNRRHRNTNILRDGHPIVNKFIDFINIDTRSQICKNCSSLHVSNHTFCTICGNNLFIKAQVDTYPHFNLERKKVMAYSKLKTDAEGRLAEDCPICGNDNVRDNFCSVCGIPIINKCSGMRKTDDNWNGGYEEDQPCSEILNGADRYCPKCGAESTFYFHHLLEDWGAPKKANTINVDLNIDPFDTIPNIDISDEDLPF